MNDKEICNLDNRLQRKLLRGEISEAEFNFRKTKLHKDYVIATSENKVLDRILKKHGGC